MLLRNCKKKSKVDADILFHVNESGMCSHKIILGYSKEKTYKRKVTGSSREPILVTLDSNCSNILNEESKRFEKYNIYLMLIP